MNDKWCTPDYLFNMLNERFRFTLDPCCEHNTAKCIKYFTEKDNGLSKEWSGEVVFCNPPYSRGNIDKWMKKCYNESLKGTIIVALIPVSSSSKWWHKYVWKHCDIEFLDHRVKFKGALHSAPFSNCLAIYNYKAI